MRWMKCLVAAAAFSALAAGAAQAEDDGVKVDCADLDMAIKAPDFEVTCEDFSNTVAASSLGRLHAELLTGVSKKQGQFVASGISARSAIPISSGAASKTTFTAFSPPRNSMNGRPPRRSPASRSRAMSTVAAAATRRSASRSAAR